MSGPVRVHVAVGDNDQFCAQLPQGTGGFGEFDVKADQQTDTDAFEQGCRKTVAWGENPAVRCPKVGLAVGERYAFRRDQHGGVVETTVACGFGHPDDHGNVLRLSGLLDCRDARAIQWLGDAADVFFGWEAHQLGFREDQQIGIGAAVADRLDGALQVVRGIAIATGQLDKLYLHFQSSTNGFDRHALAAWGVKNDPGTGSLSVS
ncbi:hypothetical protein D3C72_871470 [compost metagenome]